MSQAGNHGETEGEGLAGTRGAAAEHIATFEGGRDGGGLDWERRRNALALQLVHDWHGQAKALKRAHRGKCSLNLDLGAILGPERVENAGLIHAAVGVCTEEIALSLDQCGRKTLRAQ